MKLPLQGLSLPTPPVCASTPLPEHTILSPQPPPTDPLELHEAEDTVGQANVRSQGATYILASALQVGANVTLDSHERSRTTEWRRRKLAEEVDACGSKPSTKRPRREKC